MTKTITGDKMNEIMRAKEITGNNDQDDLSNRSINNQLGSKVNINNKSKTKKKKRLIQISLYSFL